MCGNIILLYRQRDDDSRIRRAAVVILDPSVFLQDFLDCPTRNDNTERPSARHYVRERLNIKTFARRVKYFPLYIIIISMLPINIKKMFTKNVYYIIII